MLTLRSAHDVVGPSERFDGRTAVELGSYNWSQSI